jgi:hypothetical protein
VFRFDFVSVQSDPGDPETPSSAYGRGMPSATVKVDPTAAS